MPGKVNPVIPEVMNQVSYKVIGNDLCVAMSGEAAQMELNVMEPVMAQCCFESADLLMNGFDTLRTLCIDGITANEEKCRRDVHNSIGVVTALNPVIVDIGWSLCFVSLVYFMYLILDSFSFTRKKNEINKGNKLIMSVF